jgi:hypothetical protein
VFLSRSRKGGKETIKPMAKGGNKLKKRDPEAKPVLR